MKTSEVEEQLKPLRDLVKQQGDVIRKMKLDGVPEVDIKKEVLILKARKKELEDTILKMSPPNNFDRIKMADVCKRRFFYDNSFAIYGGITGQYDFGPMGCDIIDNILSEWDKHFIKYDSMSKVKCSVLTPENVLKASGHVDKFADYMVKDSKSGDCFRLDHLIKQGLQKLNSDEKTRSDKIDKILNLLEGMTMDEMNDVVKEFKLKSPTTGNDLTDAVEFNLMFPISIGPSGALKGFLRPETSQGIFVNFKRLLETNQGRLPLACAQVGNAYRNEISPRAGLLRVREFVMAEIEHFCDPNDKSHPKFIQVKDCEMRLYSACNQMDGESPRLIKIGEAVEKKLVANETLGYYMARIQQFLHRIGIDPEKLRFRQHLSNEMAHYACDCWDAECLTSYGWIECVGCADRSAYDLTQHTKATGVKLCAERTLLEPKTVESVTLLTDKGKIGKTFKADAKRVHEILNALDESQMKELNETLDKNGDHSLADEFNITREMVTGIKSEVKTIHVEEIVPSVIEPSFGVGRVFYALLEHSFRVREDDDQRTYFALPPTIAPVKVCVLPLSSKAELIAIVEELANSLSASNISVRVDNSTGSIGRRYARTDEIAIPFGVTVDFDTLSSDEQTVTLRERNSTLQIRLPLAEVTNTVKILSEGNTTWEHVMEKWPRFVSQENAQ